VIFRKLYDIWTGIINAKGEVTKSIPQDTFIPSIWAHEHQDAIAFERTMRLLLADAFGIPAENLPEGFWEEEEPKPCLWCRLWARLN